MTTASMQISENRTLLSVIKSRSSLSFKCSYSLQSSLQRILSYLISVFVKFSWDSVSFYQLLKIFFLKKHFFISEKNQE